MQLITATSTVALKAKLFRGLGDSSRLSILVALQERPLTVNEIVAATGLTQPNTSNHLSCLRECGLVAGEQQGRFVRYSLSDGRIAKLLSLADDVLSDVAHGMNEWSRFPAPKDE